MSSKQGALETTSAVFVRGHRSRHDVSSAFCGAGLLDVHDILLTNLL